MKRNSHLHRFLAALLGLLLLAGCRTLTRHIQWPGQGAPSPAPPSSAASQPVFVTASRLSLHSCPDLDCESRATLTQGQELILLGLQLGWLQVRLPRSSLTGWVDGRRVSSHRPSSAPAASKSGAMPTVNEEWAAPHQAAPPNREVREEFVR